MTHKEARKLGLWMGAVEVSWLDEKGKWNEKRFSKIVDANKYADALLVLKKVKRNTCLTVDRRWRESIRQVQGV